MNCLVTADLHLTDRKMDAYRWELFQWLLNKVRQYGPEELYILGDLTHQKDKHSSNLVNRLCDNLKSITRRIPVIILKGNHDYIDEDRPFFNFLNDLPRIEFISKPTVRNNILLLPHTKHPVNDWEKFDFKTPYDYIFFHGTMRNAMSSSGYKLTSSIQHTGFEGRQVIAGDVHVPQKVRNVEYVGSPYPINFGDNFEGRVLLLQKSRKISLFPKLMWKVSLRMRTLETLIDTIDERRIRRGDQIKIIMVLPRAEFHEWPKHREEITEICHSAGIVLCGLELEEKKRKKFAISGGVSIPISSDPIDPNPTHTIQRSTAAIFRDFVRNREEHIDDYTVDIGKEMLIARNA